MKKITLLLIAISCSLSLASFGQNTEFQIVDSLRNKKHKNIWQNEVQAFSIREQSIIAFNYTLKDIDNPEYIKKKNQFDSLTLIKTGLDNELNQFLINKKHYYEAKSLLSDVINNKESKNWDKLEMAQKCLNKTNRKFELICDKKELYAKLESKDYSLAVNQAQDVLSEIIQILSSEKALNSKIHKFDTDNSMYSSMQRFGVGFGFSYDNTPKTIQDYVPTTSFKRRILIVDTTINCASSLSGKLFKESDPLDYKNGTQYRLMNQNFRQFLRNEIVLSDTLVKYATSPNRVSQSIDEEYNYLIRDASTKKLYYTKGDILKSWCIKSELADLYKIFEDLKISISKVGNDIILRHEGYKCVLTEDVTENLIKKDVSIIKKMQLSVNEYVSYNHSSEKIAEKLRKHISAYKSGLMTQNRLSEWEKDTKDCDMILEKMSNIPFVSSDLFFWQLEIKEVELHNAITDWVEYSKNLLGI